MPAHFAENALVKLIGWEPCQGSHRLSFGTCTSPCRRASGDVSPYERVICGAPRQLGALNLIARNVVMLLRLAVFTVVHLAIIGIVISLDTDRPILATLLQVFS
jgi:hypothetical protein